MISVEIGLVLRLENELSAGTYEGALVRQWVWGAGLLAEQVDERTKLSHRNVVIAAILAQQTGFDELSPRNGARAGRLEANDRTIRPVAPPTALKPVMQSRRRDAE